MELEQFYGTSIGKTVTVADVFTMAAAIENEYRKRGYVITRVVVPEQQIESGAVRILVIEGFISEIRYGSDIGAARAQVEALIGTLRDIRPISIADIERRLLLANDLRGVHIRGTLEPSPTVRGASTLVVTAERDPFDLSLTLDNRNSPYTGSNEAIVHASMNSFTSQAGTLSMMGKSAFPYRRENLWQLAYGQSIGADGLTANVSALTSESRPGRNLRPLNVHSEVFAASANVSYPLIRSRQLNLRLEGSFDYTDLETEVLSRPYTEDKLRVLRLGATFDRLDTYNGFNAARVTISQGLDIFDASPRNSELLSRFDGLSNFTKISAQFARMQNLPANFSLLATATGQYTEDSLLASEQIGLGGPEFGRAYDTSEVSGDKGIDGLLELRFRPPYSNALLEGSQFFVYYDVGKVWNIGSEIPRSESLASAGAGARLQLPANFFVTLEGAKALTHVVASEGDKPTRFFFSVSTIF